jgi:HJR/Mrr/RecB family endonuclease
MIGINEELKTIEAAMAVLSTTNANSKAMIRVLREAKYVAALAMTTLPSDKPLNDARHAVVITLSDLVQALETDPAAQQEKIDKAKEAIRNLEWALKATLELRLRNLAEGDQL